MASSCGNDKREQNHPESRLCWESLLFCHSGPRIFYLVLGVQMRCSAARLLVGDLDGAVSVTASVIAKANPQPGSFFWLVVGKL